ncbi:MAG: class I SAM-dependent methyltransferase, partial [Candidatus Pacebacteria bacterium]|nr:class I SAM-dependent methyltransferase [Candidatus Paceibacterota bacterium]
MRNNYREKLKREKNWYINSGFNKKHFLNSRLFYSPERNRFNYVFPKKQFFKFVAQIIDSSKIENPRILIAPIGNGDDIRYMEYFTNDIYGIDISEEAIAKISSNIKKYSGDISNMYMFTDDFFDIIISPLFFHHYIEFGFDNFLKEMHRVLKPNGHFFSLEPSIFYPITWVTLFGKKIFGNITGCIEDERAFIPSKLSNSMK